MEKPDSAPVKSFIADLNELRLRAGQPSLSELARLSGQKMSKSTIKAHLHGQRVGLPPWRLVSAFVAACHAAAQSTGIEEPLGSLRQWHARWDAAVKRLSDPPSPFEDSTEPIENTTDREPEGPPVPGDGRGLLSGPPPRRLYDIERIQKSLSADAALLVVTSAKFTDIYELNRNITTIGRSWECDIWLNDKAISWRHAQIHRYGDRFTIVDLDSTNGTFCQGRGIFRETFLRSSDELGIGPFRLLFVQGGTDTHSLNR